MKYNIEVDGDTKFVIFLALQQRLDNINKELANAKQYNFKSTEEFWQLQFDNVTNALDAVNKNSKIVW